MIPALSRLFRIKHFIDLWKLTKSPRIVPLSITSATYTLRKSCNRRKSSLEYSSPLQSSQPSENQREIQGSRVCKKWRSQVDENVSFHTCLCDGNYDEVSRRLGTFCCVTSIWIDDYSKTDIPVHNLTSLKNLTVNGTVHKLALTELLSKAHLPKPNLPSTFCGPWNRKHNH
ncbi:unnamed protein product [Orchesella dallaii]|uniref:Uncharacterized protein n=1 Tax=Orchesella dallaii TaxID=48710 RepID=A0ABP1R889_9HEXA